MVEYVSIPVPKPLYERLAKTLEGSGYRSATEQHGKTAESPGIHTVNH